MTGLDRDGNPVSHCSECKQPLPYPKTICDDCERALIGAQRCEDAPCCGHVRCGFGPGVPGYGSMVNGRPYYGESS